MFGNTKKVLHTLQKSEVIKSVPIMEKKSTFISIFEAIDKATNAIREGVNPDPSKDDIETQTKKLYEIAVKEVPDGLPEKQDYQYLGSSGQENYYARTNYNMETKKLNSIQVINSVDEEVANVNNELDEPAARLVSQVVDQLRLDSVSFKLLVDVGAIDLEPDVITPADGTEGGGAGGPGSSTASGGSPTGAADDGAMGNTAAVPGEQGAQEAGDEGGQPALGELGNEDEDRKKLLVGGKESKQVKGIPSPWAKTLSEAVAAQKSIKESRASKANLPEGEYRIIEKGNKISLVAKVISEKTTSAKYRYLVSNEDVNVSITSPEGTTNVTSGSGGTTVSVDSGGQEEQVVVSTEPAAVASSADVNVVPEIDGAMTDDTMGGQLEEIPSGEAQEIQAENGDEPDDMEEEDEFEIPEGRSVPAGKYKITEVKKDTWGNANSYSMKLMEKGTPDERAKKKIVAKSKKGKIKEAKQVVKVRPEQGEGPWIVDPMQIKGVLTNAASLDHIVDYVDNGQKGVALLSQLQGTDIQVGPEVVKIAILDPAVASAQSAAPAPEHIPITPSEANLEPGEKPAPILPAGPNEAKVPDVVNYDADKVINDLLEKHGIKENGVSTPASKEDAGGTATINKDGQGTLDKGGINLDDKGGPITTKASSPASKEDDGGTASISGDGQGKLETGDINRDDEGGLPPGASASSPAASNDAGKPRNTGTSGDTTGAAQPSAAPVSVETLESIDARESKFTTEEHVGILNKLIEKLKPITESHYSVLKEQFSDLTPEDYSKFIAEALTESIVKSSFSKDDESSIISSFKESVDRLSRKLAATKESRTKTVLENRKTAAETKLANTKSVITEKKSKMIDTMMGV